MTDIDPIALARMGSWAATGIGLALWLWSWFGEKDPIKKLRFSDCAVVLVFSAVLVRLLIQDRAMTAIDWALAVIAPLFILSALWRLTKTGQIIHKDRTG